ncbi:succinate dehydrogenase assembly factor 3, mitochondrial-like [Actinia tenebrosa]|uniref:Succinate dehydrogenase assembly factor 3 n=1 Tax=Actinia tenebrosa TaxID=6105 RepID=A0A6P8HZ24_ACTTE|nr:succinate dehydrogenase assembly factor 3, mitochondrial-like [Actinia tenebrosa]
MTMSTSHVYAVKTLYCRILSLHRGLPLELRALGDQYIRDEFRRHKNVTMEQGADFLQEWKMYADMLQQQQKQGLRNLGNDLSVNEIDSFSDEQIGQLFALHQEATTSSSEENKDKTNK